ncbi:MAG TPA: nitroreductase family protein [Spirochaetia bacterium]|nr:nitroreductase family protein [Spirochaetia bacterium]
MEPTSFDILARARRSCRNFRDQPVDKTIIQSILEAGWLAPHAGATGIALADKRRFFVIQRGGASHHRLYSLALARIKANRNRLRVMRRFVPGLAQKTTGFMKRLDALASGGIPTLQEAPVWIIAAERKGFPPAESKSLAHVFQNVWLKATELGIGFMLLSLTGMLGGDAAFMTELGLAKGEWELDGCLIGMPVRALEPSTVHLPASAVCWLD